MQSKENCKPASTSAGACPPAPFLILAAALAFVALPSSAQWSTVGGDQGNTRYSLLTQINSQNVTKLGAAWISEKVGPPPSSRAMPVSRRTRTRLKYLRRGSLAGVS